ncbi:hypothetical protein N7509_003932 [Penicillium cosmopolitanum]|uniref:RNase III domain-containing protein n=1 Tax=Penicillium cosmopolitanum TaxID=1131564 RepID=A0A9W9W685_9EURO|nr:uncharacterized protein N7509_003932 [Penicillium cosmopolitanum]KAJ5404061.1 hypothetical protein N7509_003932 [Penicillium cosmopolitanum]
MSSKRSRDASGGRHSSETDKRIKTNHSIANLPADSSTSKYDSAQKSQSISHLSTLKQLIREVKKDTDLLKAEPNIATTISTLDTLLLQKDAKEETSQVNKGQKTSQSTSDSRKNEDGSRHPDLPPILDDRLEKAVFTHPACANDSNANYDRLELLGDAYIELIATKLIWKTFPGLASGRISQIRELLVKNETLSAFADSYGFSRRAVVPQDYDTQLKRWVKIRGDIFEAYVAAIILSDPVGGYEVAEQWLTSLWLPKLVNLGPQNSKLNSKDELSTKVMGNGTKLKYIEEKPSIHPKGTGSQTYFIGVYFTGWGWENQHLGSGQGLKKNAAGDEAARNALANPLVTEINLKKKTLLGNK